MEDRLQQVLDEHREVISELDITTNFFIEPDTRSVIEPYHRSKQRWERVRGPLLTACSSLGNSVVGDECVDILRRFHFRCMEELTPARRSTAHLAGERVEPSESASSPVSRSRAVNQPLIPGTSGLPEAELRNDNVKRAEARSGSRSTEVDHRFSPHSGRNRFESVRPGLRRIPGKLLENNRVVDITAECSDGSKSKRLRRSRTDSLELSPLSAQDLLSEADHFLLDEADETSFGDTQDGPKKDCGFCGGTGRVAPKERFKDPKYYDHQSNHCPTCKGEGKVPQRDYNQVLTQHGYETYDSGKAWTDHRNHIILDPRSATWKHQKGGQLIHAGNNPTELKDYLLGLQEDLEEGVPDHLHNMPEPLHRPGTKVLYANRVHTYEGPKHGAVGYHRLKYQGYNVDAHEDDFHPYEDPD